MRAWSSLALTALATAVAACGGSSASENEAGTDSGSSAESSAPGSDAATGLDASSSEVDAALGTDAFIPGPDSSIPGPDATTGPDGGGADASAIDAPGSGICTVGALPSGGTTQTGNNINGTADGLGYGVWSNGSGGSITTFANATAFSASWNNGGDFLAHLALDFNSSQSYTTYGTIAAHFAESKTGTAGGHSSIGMYGWTQNPCVEWYIVEDSLNSFSTQRSSVTATIDGGTYYLISNTTTGSGGNDCGGSATGSGTTRPSCASEWTTTP